MAVIGMWDAFPGGVPPLEDMRVCPKCRYTSGDSWSQCGMICPMEMSPYYSEAAAYAYTHGEYAAYERMEPISPSDEDTIN